MAPESGILSLSLCNEVSSQHLAVISLLSGQEQRPTWRGLYRYWKYAKADQVEYSAASYSGHYAVFCLTVASGQGGIIAVWNTYRRRWEHVSEAAYVTCAMIIEDISAVVSLHYVSCWGVPGHHTLSGTPPNRTLDGFADVSLPLTAVHFNQGFDPKLEMVKKAAYGNYVRNDNGPLGIFLLEEGNSIIAHDAGNFYNLSIAEVEETLKSSNLSV